MRASSIRSIAIVVLAGVVLIGCSSLPRGAAFEREIVGAAEDDTADFAVYEVTRGFLPVLDAWPHTGESHLSWIPTSGGARTQVIAAGDELQVTIWDSNENSLLSAEGQRAVQIEALTVAPDGTVFVPYVGETQVSGMTVQVARQHLQDEIDMVVPSAQVQLQIAEGRTNSVDLVGGVNAPGAYPLPDRNYTVLNLIAQGGGVRSDLQNPQVRLLRAGELYGTSVERLFANPGLDTLLRGGDQVLVEEDRRYFLSLGAAGQQSQHPFTQDEITALDAISIIGGVSSSRGDPGGILILREYPQSAVRVGPNGPDKDRVVFSIDLTTADGLFSARNFHIHSEDLVFVTESPVTGLQTIFGLIGSAVGLANTASNVAQ